mmetsp:Transcript_34972/g.99137  ORF Transcript_34972/g.99137 Transcript_34972/m.99137 type:complete len:483 (-) Transcript_34972:68-1516(-)
MNPSMEAQFNIRNNTMELQEYMKDLMSWESSVKKKDKDLKKGRLPGSGDGGGAPAPRGRASAVGAAPEHLQAPALEPNSVAQRTAKKKKSKLKGQSGKAQAPSAAGHTYDHYKDKWEKFDVDAALASDGEEEEEEEAAVNQQVHDNTPPIRKPLDSEGWRSKGNEWFKLGDYRQAKDCYSASIAEEPNCLAHANRAMACLKLGEVSLAEEDCTAAVSLDPLYMKAWQRRGAARKQLGNLEGACSDCEMALRLQPGSAALQREFEACFASLQTQRRLMPLRRRARVAVRMEEGPAASQSRSAGVPLPPAGGAAAEAPQKEPASASGSQPEEARGRPAAKLPASAVVSQAVEIVSRSAGTHSAPKTSTEFETAWKGFTGDMAAQAAYLRLVDPASLPSLFKSSLTGPLLSGIAGTALSAASDDPAWAVALLEGLTSVPRFDMTAMLLPRDSKAALRRSLEACMSGLPDADLRSRLETVKAKLRV